LGQSDRRPNRSQNSLRRHPDSLSLDGVVLGGMDYLGMIRIWHVLTVSALTGFFVATIGNLIVLFTIFMIHIAAKAPPTNQTTASHDMAEGFGFPILIHFSYGGKKFKKKGLLIKDEIWYQTPWFATLSTCNDICSRVNCLLTVL
jgi:hypothetical protein